MNRYSTARVPKELNFVKNVADLKFNSGATITTRNIGTVVLRSQIRSYNVHCLVVLDVTLM
jgi:hypothetical protein